MTSRRTLFLTVLATTLAGIGGYEARVLIQQREQLEGTNRDADAVEQEIRAMRHENGRISQQIAAAEQQLAQLSPDTTRAGEPSESKREKRETEIKAWLARVGQLQQLFAERPKDQIPELRLLMDADWLRVAKTSEFATEDQIRSAMAQLRTTAKQKLHSEIAPALQRFSQGSNRPPPSVESLSSYFEGLIDRAILERYEIATDTAHGTGWVFREKAPIDPDHDIRIEWTTSGGQRGSSAPAAWIPDFHQNLQRAEAEFSAAHKGRLPSGLGEVLPYYKPALGPDTVKRLVQMEQARPGSPP